MNFSVNSPILFVLAGIIILAVLLQSVFFLVRAVRRSKEIGMDQQKLRKTMVTAGVFTIAPAVAIVISVITLSKDLGLPLPWLRLSVVGSLSYETIAATNAESAMGLTFGQVSALTASQYVTIAWVMTISIMLGIWLVPLIGKKLQGGMTKIENRDKRWGDILSSALFIGMIAAFLGYVFCDFGTIFPGMRYDRFRRYYGAVRPYHEKNRLALGGRLRPADESYSRHGLRYSHYRLAVLRERRITP